MSKDNGVIKIEKGIPLPVSAANRVYPFDQMEIGDSFVMDSKKTQKGLYNAAHYRKVKIKVRKISETQSRVWRIA